MLSGAGFLSTALRARRAVFREMDASRPGASALTALNRGIFLLIVLVVVLSVLETEPTISAGHAVLFQRFEDFFGVVFSIEYLIRLWTAPEDPRYGPGLMGRVRYVLSPSALLDLAAIAVSFGTPTGLKPFLLRIFRLLRILRVAKLGRMSRAMAFLVDAVMDRREELLFSLIIGLVFLTLSATALYLVEGPVQPDKFGSIPRALWWAVATLTTIGYGDVYPLTALGKVVAAVCSLAGIGLVAMPTGIMAAAFSDAIQRHHRDDPPKGT